MNTFDATDFNRRWDEMVLQQQEAEKLKVINAEKDRLRIKEFSYNIHSSFYKQNPNPTKPECISETINIENKHKIICNKSDISTVKDGGSQGWCRTCKKQLWYFPQISLSYNHNQSSKLASPVYWHY